jgi:hypothetical protein
MIFVFIFFRKAITEKIKGLLLFELAKGDFNTKMLFYKIEDLVAIKEKPKKKSTKYPTDKLDEVNTSETVIPHIYSEIMEPSMSYTYSKASNSESSGSDFLDFFGMTTPVNSGWQAGLRIGILF